MEKYVKIEAHELRELLRAEAIYLALERGGVDSWEWYVESIKDYFEEFDREKDLDELIDEWMEDYPEVSS